MKLPLVDLKYNLFSQNNFYLKKLKIFENGPNSEKRDCNQKMIAWVIRGKGG